MLLALISFLARGRSHSISTRIKSRIYKKAAGVRPTLPQHKKAPACQQHTRRPGAFSISCLRYPFDIAEITGTVIMARIDSPSIWLKEKYEVTARVTELARLRKLA
jgi:hypothetical protein